MKRVDEILNQISALQDELGILQGDERLTRAIAAQHKFWELHEGVLATFERTDGFSLKYWSYNAGDSGEKSGIIYWPSFDRVAREIDFTEFQRRATLFIDRAILKANNARESLAKTEPPTPTETEVKK